MTALEITTRADGNGTIRIRIAGEIDMATAPQLAAAAQQATAANPLEVLLDLAAVTFLDCIGIHALVTAQRDATERGVQLRVVNTQDHVRKVLDLTGLRRTLDGSNH